MDFEYLPKKYVAKYIIFLIGPFFLNGLSVPDEFGIKDHIMQVGGINIVEQHSFEVFNETIRLKLTYFKIRSLIGSCTHLEPVEFILQIATEGFVQPKSFKPIS